MKPHELYEMAMPRGAAQKVARELGLKSSTIPKSWRRPAEGPANLFSGRLSYLQRAKDEVLAHDRVSSTGTNILLFDLFVADVARQRKARRLNDPDELLAKLVTSYQGAISAFVSGDASHETEQKLYRAGAELVGVLVDFEQRRITSVPLMKVETTNRWWHRARNFVRGR